jgi:choline monooxygenase
MSAPFDIHPDIRRASTPPARIYTDPAFFRICQERVFATSWHLAAQADAVRVPGSVYPFTLLEGCLDEPLLLTRDRADVLHCLSNVCTHRGHLVCPHAEHLTRLRCRYHGRRFALDGRFEHMPEFEGVEGFPTPADDLARVPFEVWQRFVFVSLRPSAPLAEVLRPVRERVSWMPLDELKFDASRSRDYLVQANWALYCENYLEGFHIPFVHEGLNQAIDFHGYRTELFEHASLQVGLAQSGTARLEPPAGSTDHGQRVAGYYFWFFPATMLNFYPWGLSINVVKPLGPERTRVSFLTFVWDPSQLESGAGAGLDRVEREDEAVVEAVQRGVRSRLYQRGRYAPKREQGTHHFHRLLAGALGGS